MPIYVFKCTNPDCAHSFEIRQNTYVTVAMTNCPRCGSPAGRQISMASTVHIRIK